MKKRYNVHLEQGVLFLEGQENRKCCVFISDIGIRGIYLSLTLCTAKLKLLDESCALQNFSISFFSVFP